MVSSTISYSLSTVVLISSGVEGLGRGRVVGDEDRQPPTAAHEELLMLTLKVLSPLHVRREEEYILTHYIAGFLLSKSLTLDELNEKWVWIGMKDMTYFRFKFKFVTFLVLSGEDVNSFSVGQSFVGNKKHTMPAHINIKF